MSQLVVPNDWEITSLVDRASIGHGFAFKSEYFRESGDCAVTTAGNFYEEGGFRNVGVKQRYYAGEFPVSYLLQPGDLIVAMTEQAEGLLGSAAIVPGDAKYLHNQRIGRVRFNSSSIRLDFLYWLFNSRDYRVAVRETAAGTKVKHTSPSKLLSIPVPIPPVEEQERIADVLNTVASLCTSLERLIAKKKAIKQGMMQQLLTGKTRLPGFSGQWSRRPIGEVSSVTMGQSPPGSSYNSSGVGAPLIQGNADIHDRRTFDRVWTIAPTKRVREGEIVLTVRAPVGYTAIASKDACLGRGVCGIAAGTSTQFLFHALVSAEPTWSILEQGSTFTSVNSNQVRAFQVDWPEDAEERTAIAAVLNDVDSEIVVLLRRLQTAHEIKQGMMQELLTGRTRLIQAEVAA